MKAPCPEALTHLGLEAPMHHAKRPPPQGLEAPFPETPNPLGLEAPFPETPNPLGLEAPCPMAPDPSLGHEGP
ncbi:hypothetical protein KY285_026948 [Solanum tuberosum]|nr:hypothetical protein KY285_026948 [Solanum tuberosum]